MLLPLLALPLLQAAASPVPQAQDTTGRTYNGRANQLDVRLPRLEAAVQVDGVLDEPVWRSAAVLTGFSMYAPVDQRPAPDSTEVLVWYSERAIHFGIRAFEPHGAVRATLAERDQIGNDDNVELHLDTFGDRRRAFVFIVNPLGVQADGMKAEGGGWIPGGAFPGETDESPDFIWESKGRVTEFGYEVEVRIPFRSLRYRVASVQTWGIQVVRNVQHSRYELTWTPALRGSASFISQSGRLVDMTRMHHGQVVEVIPELTAGMQGAARTTDGRWEYRDQQSLGANVRWGMGSNFVLNGTVKPDFSQVEADALEIPGDQRFAVYYPEKRPFFIEGSEQFNVPNTLVYTRQIVQPDAAAKVTGRIGESDLAVLTAIDSRAGSRSGTDNPFVGIVRLRRDLRGQSTAGLIYSDRTESGDVYNRLLGADARIVFGGIYFAQAQFVGSTTRDGSGAGAVNAPLWQLMADRTGRRFGFNYTITGVDHGFAAWNGFVPRTGYVAPSLANRFTFYGREGALMEQYTVRVFSNALWDYDDFFAARRVRETDLGTNHEIALRGGWEVELNPGTATFTLTPDDYAGLFVQQGASYVPYMPPAETRVAGIFLELDTPQWRRFAASLGGGLGTNVDFADATRVARYDVELEAAWRPTERVRVDASVQNTRFIRPGGGESYTATIPRVRSEYQITRALFVRFVGQYEAERRAAPRDPKTGTVLYRQTSSGYVAGTDEATNDFRVDWLVSYRPNPGTVFFAGYGSSLDEPTALRFRNLQRRDDAFFLKLSYLIRM